MTDLVECIAASLRAHDPLDPWLTESAVDDDYWSGEAREIESRLRHGMTPLEVRAIVVDVLGDLLGSSADGDAGLQEQRRRLDAIADRISAALR